MHDKPVCHWCHRAYTPQQITTLESASIRATWGCCEHCDSCGRVAGEPGFDPVRQPRINLLSFRKTELAGVGAPGELRNQESTHG
jgi:hypothetical protein